MKKWKKIVLAVLLFSQPMIGIPIGIVLGTHAAIYCADTINPIICIQGELERTIETIF